MRHFTEQQIEQLVYDLGARRAKEILDQPELTPTERISEHTGFCFADDPVEVAKNVFRDAQVRKAMFGRTPRCASAGCANPVTAPGFCAVCWSAIKARWA